MGNERYWMIILVVLGIIGTLYFIQPSSPTTEEHQSIEEDPESVSEPEPCPSNKLCYYGSRVVPKDLALEIHGPSWYGILPDLSNPSTINYHQDVQEGQRHQKMSPEAEHLYLHYMYNHSFGTYVEMGALDGLVFSNTDALNRLWGWRGLLIEASPISYPRLIVNRPNDLCIRAAVCDRFTQVHWITRAQNLDVQGIYEFMTPDFLRTWHPTVTNDNLETNPNATLLACCPLDYLLHVAHFSHINFFSLDVEGGELSVLQSFDWDRVKVDVWCIEKHYGVEIIKLMESHGYIYEGEYPKNWNIWFRHHTFEPRPCKKLGGPNCTSQWTCEQLSGGENCPSK